MKRALIAVFLCLGSLVVSGMDIAHAGSAPSGGSPPIGQMLVREGDYAVRLAYALRVATTDNEIEAESRLGELGISPANGWIADYPVTPDILAQLQNGVLAAADGGRLIMGRDDALKYMSDVNREFGLPSVSVAAAGSPGSAAPAPAPVVINNYYTSAGPPVVTYYAPPTGWVYLYTWVPYPFWCAGFHFSGYYILRDFDRVVIVRNRPVHISNHYWDRRHQAYRVHPPRPVYRAAPLHVAPRPLPRVVETPHAVARPLPRTVETPHAVAPFPRAAAANPRVAAPNPRAAAPLPRTAGSPAQVSRDRQQGEGQSRQRVERADHNQDKTERFRTHGERRGDRT